MKVKLLILLLLGSLVSGTGVWAAKESSVSNYKAKASFCCGFCVPDEPCLLCGLKKKAQ